MKRLIIAIDGPSGAGKGTIARTIAQALKYRHVDTGAMYRAVGWKAQHDRVPLDDEAEVAALANRSRINVEGGRVLSVTLGTRAGTYAVDVRSTAPVAMMLEVIARPVNRRTGFRIAAVATPGSSLALPAAVAVEVDPRAGVPALR